MTLYIEQDYLIVIPSVQYEKKAVLDIQDIDKSSEFISKCGSNDFNIEYARLYFVINISTLFIISLVTIFLFCA